MAELQNFRSAFNGFNREDVVHYIEYLNNRHNAQTNQLNNEIQALKAELNLARADTVRKESPAPQPAEADRIRLEQELAEARQQLAEAREQLAQANIQLAQANGQLALLQQQAAEKSSVTDELEAYRRAERMERLAQERAEQLYAQANGVLADASVKVDEAAAQIGSLADEVSAHLNTLQAAVSGSKDALKDAAAALCAIRPGSVE